MNTDTPDYGPHIILEPLIMFLSRVFSTQE